LRGNERRINFERNALQWNTRDLKEIDMAASPNLRFINPSTMAKPPGYTHVIEATGPGRIVYIAGQLGLTLEGKLAGPPGDFRAQATQAFENLKNALAAVGAGFEHVVKLNNYLTDIRAQLPIYRDVRDSHVVTANPPASTTLEVSKLAIDGALYEVEAAPRSVARKGEDAKLRCTRDGLPRRPYPLDPAIDSRLDGRRFRFRVAKARAAD
jgi:enamine deaminase RidA (YjgF/YER057c/UK114 family)